MEFLFINTQELSALMELPLIQRVTYLMGIRPYMDRQTGIVGIKRRISYQSLREVLYVAPIAGVKTGSPSQQQVKRAIKSLEKYGLISIQSTVTWSSKCIHSVKLLFSFCATPTQIDLDSCNQDMNATDNYYKTSRYSPIYPAVPHNAFDNVSIAPALV